MPYSDNRYDTRIPTTRIARSSGKRATPERVLNTRKGLNAREITAARILKRSIDARQRTIYVNLNVRAYLNEMPKEDEYQHTLYNNVEGKPQVIVVGAGPGGLLPLCD